MAVLDLYSKRQKRLRGEVIDVYAYDFFPHTFRTQLSFMIQELLGDLSDYYDSKQPRKAYENIVRALRKEYGLPTIAGDQGTVFKELHVFLIVEPDVERCLDAVELCYGYGGEQARSPFYIPHRMKAKEHVDACVIELNERFKEAGLGYELIDSKIIRIDSQLIHSEIVKPAIGFLNGEKFAGPRDEFLGAYEHFRHGNHEEALVDALKAFESTMKVILTTNEITYGAGDTASKLILACKDAGLMPAYNESQLQSLVNVLTSGIPTLRNKNGGHGQGEAIRTVEPEIVAYGLHLTASAVVMLAGLESKRRVDPLESGR